MYANLHNRAFEQHAPVQYLSVPDRTSALDHYLSYAVCPTVFLLSPALASPRINKDAKSYVKSSQK